MSKQKLTPWFPADVKPVRDGVYQRLSDIDGGAYFSRFTSRNGWHNLTSVKRGAARSKSTSIRTLPWRGLTSPGEKA